MSSIPFTRQYNSFRVSGGPNLTNGGMLGTNCRSSLKKVQPRKLVNGTGSQEASPAVTPRLCRKLAASSNSSPLQSPVIIRRTAEWKKRGPHHVKTCTMHSKSPGSSGTSVESIVPKYSNGGALLRPNVPDNNSGSQKRAYNVYSKPAKVINTRIKPSINVHSSTTQHSNKISNSSTNESTTIKQQPFGSKMSNKPNIVNSSSKENNYTAFSSKFPNGLPFEDEFYHRRRKSLSETSSLTSSSDSADSRNFNPFEDDEFSRKPSNEALYVDFTKPLEKPSLATTMTTTTTLNPLSEYNRLNAMTKVESTKKLLNGINVIKKATTASSRIIDGKNNYEKNLFSAADCLENSGKQVTTSENNGKTKSVAYVSASAAAASKSKKTWVPSSDSGVIDHSPDYEDDDTALSDDLEPTVDNLKYVTLLN